MGQLLKFGVKTWAYLVGRAENWPGIKTGAEVGTGAKVGAGAKTGDENEPGAQTAQGLIRAKARLGLGLLLNMDLAGLEMWLSKGQG